MYIFLLLMIVFFYFYKKYNRVEIAYALIYIAVGLFISLFYVLKEFIFTPEKMNYKQIIMQDALYNHKGEILDEFETFPLYREFITFHLGRKSEDPYDDTVTSLQAVKYMNDKMIDSLYIPLASKDPLIAKYKLPLKEAIGRFIRYAGDLPIIIYNQPFTHTYLNVKLDKEIHISFIDAMVMSKDIYGITNKPIRDVKKYLKFINLESDNVQDAKVIGAIYLDYIYTVTKFKKAEARKKAKKARESESSALEGETHQAEVEANSIINATAVSSSLVPASGKKHWFTSKNRIPVSGTSTSEEGLEESVSPIQNALKNLAMKTQPWLKGVSVSIGNKTRKISPALKIWSISFSKSLKRATAFTARKWKAFVAFIVKNWKAFAAFIVRKWKALTTFTGEKTEGLKKKMHERQAQKKQDSENNKQS